MSKSKMVVMIPYALRVKMREFHVNWNAIATKAFENVVARLDKTPPVSNRSMLDAFDDDLDTTLKTQQTTKQSMGRRNWYLRGFKDAFARKESVPAPGWEEPYNLGLAHGKEAVSCLV